MGASSGYNNYMDREGTKVAESDREKTRVVESDSYFTSVSLYRDWLDTNMKDPQYCQHGAVTN